MLAMLVLACTSTAPRPEVPLRADAALHPDLAAHARLFDREVISPAPDVHVAVGFGLANVIWLEGPTGVVVVDTTEGRTAATEALAALRTVTDKPIAAVILTHNHADHVFGGQVFATEGVPVWAHRDTEAGIDQVVNVLRDAVSMRAARMFGTAIPADQRANDGIGFALRFQTSDIALARPTNTFDERVTVEAGGLTLELVHAPGETDDQLFVWWPERRVLLPADNVYQAFPNLYTIRGTAYRDVRRWVRSLDAMRALDAEVLVPQHTRPVVGADAVAGVLTAYRDAIQYVHDQTVRGINQGHTADALAAAIRLPAHLEAHPWLAEHYGRVLWSVRGIYDGYLGWFDGDPSRLEPLPPDERARRYQAAFAAGKPLGQQTREALAAGEASWAAELGALWVRASPDDAEARAVLADAYAALARGHVNPNAHHWYLTAALELRGEVTIAPTPRSEAPVDLVDGLPIDVFLAAMPTRLDPVAAADADLRVRFVFTDVGRTFTMHVRRGVAELQERDDPDAELTLTTTAQTYKRMLAGKESRAWALASGALAVEGDVGALVRFSGWFEG